MKHSGRLDSNGTPFIFPAIILDADEYSKIIHEINSVYNKYRGNYINLHISFDDKGKCYVYYFENRGFDDYNIFERKAYD